MGKLKKLSKSEPAPVGYELLPSKSVPGQPYTPADDNKTWLWACEQGCYDNPAYDKTSREDTIRVAEEHLANKHS